MADLSRLHCLLMHLESVAKPNSRHLLPGLLQGVASMLVELDLRGMFDNTMLTAQLQGHHSSQSTTGHGGTLVKLKP